MIYWARFSAVFVLANNVMATVSADMIMFPDPAKAPRTELPEFGGLPAILLNPGKAGGKVAVIETPRDWSFDFPAQRDYSLELLVIAGELRWDNESLRRHDYAYLPTGAAAPSLVGGEASTLLAYFDPPRDTDGSRGIVVHSSEKDWRAGSVAQRDTGKTLNLQVKDLRRVEATGQRTWLLRAGTDLDVPWERHNTVEEGYLLRGEYRLVECLSQGQVTSDYLPGGYFYRPAGIVHSGPESGALSEVLWLLRSPTRLDVEFLPSCEEV